MKSTIKLLILFLIIVEVLLIPSLLLPKTALADGVIIRPDPYSDRWDYLGQNRQLALINYRNGLQKMILSINMKETNKEAVWIFPVPAEPNKVVIDVVTKLPGLRGKDVKKEAETRLFEINKVLQITQIYPIIFLKNYISPPYPRYDYPILPESGAIRGDRLKSDITIYEHLEKEGITTEIITAKTAKALRQYLQNKNLKVEITSIPALNYYIGKEYTFVVSWISKTNNNIITPYYQSTTPPHQSGQRGVFVTFPTKKIYYPLILTSVYGSEVIPITIRIIGFVSPKVFKDIKDYTKISYFIDEYYRVEPELKNFYGASYNGVKKKIKYTKIEINAPSKMLTEDLWISKRSPLKASLASFFAKNEAISTILLLILNSIIAGLLAGVIVFKEARNIKGLVKFGLIGIFNCLSIIGLIIAVSFTKTKKIKKEDEKLLEKLKQRGFSIQALQRKDSRKLIFVPLFSGLFLVISWIIVKLIELSL